MNIRNNSTYPNKPDYFLDITGESCPMTFVRTKLMVEKMRPGETLEIRLKGAEPLENVPRNLEEHGHEILQLSPETPADKAEATYRLVMIKRNPG